ncbi:hypothetical protein DINM_003479 [Dirofilaria immitis]|nr:hypothetical protein [Dirofilaria immitis]
MFPDVDYVMKRVEAQSVNNVCGRFEFTPKTDDDKTNNHVYVLHVEGDDSYNLRTDIWTVQRILSNKAIFKRCGPRIPLDGQYLEFVVVLRNLRGLITTNGVLDFIFDSVLKPIEIATMGFESHNSALCKTSQRVENDNTEKKEKNTVSEKMKNETPATAANELLKNKEIDRTEFHRKGEKTKLLIGADYFLPLMIKKPTSGVRLISTSIYYIIAGIGILKDQITASLLRIDESPNEDKNELAIQTIEEYIQRNSET